MAVWLIKRAGKQIGRGDTQALQAAAEKGRLLPTDAIKKCGTDNWVECQFIKGLNFKNNIPKEGGHLRIQVCESVTGNLNSSQDLSTNLPPEFNARKNVGKANSRKGFLILLVMLGPVLAISVCMTVGPAVANTMSRIVESVREKPRVVTESNRGIPTTTEPPSASEQNPLDSLTREQLLDVFAESTAETVVKSNNEYARSKGKIYLGSSSSEKHSEYHQEFDTATIGLSGDELREQLTKTMKEIILRESARMIFTYDNPFYTD